MLSIFNSDDKEIGKAEVVKEENLDSSIRVYKYKVDKNSAGGAYYA